MNRRFAFYYSLTASTLNSSFVLHLVFIYYSAMLNLCFPSYARGIISDAAILAYEVVLTVLITWSYCLLFFQKIALSCHLFMARFRFSFFPLRYYLNTSQSSTKYFLMHQLNSSNFCVQLNFSFCQKRVMLCVMEYRDFHFLNLLVALRKGTSR